MNGSPAGGSGAGGLPPSTSSASPANPGPAMANPRAPPPWLTPDLVSALRPSLNLANNPFLNPAGAPGPPGGGQSPFLHPHPHPGVHSPYHQALYNPLTANYAAHAAAAALGSRAPFGLDPAAFLQRPYRYLLPPTSAAPPHSAGHGPQPAHSQPSRFPLPSPGGERSQSESDTALGPGRPGGPWRRPASPPPKAPRLPGPSTQPPTTSTAPAAPTLPTQPYYPSHFMRGTVIQLASGELKRVEELNTEDFVRSANLSSALKMDSSTVVRVEEKTKDIVLLCFSVGENKVQVSVEATMEHPFFVIGQGWSSCSPERTRSLYGLPCQRLQVGDICISLTHRDVSSASSAAPSSALAASLRRRHPDALQPPPAAPQPAQPVPQAATADHARLPPSLGSPPAQAPLGAGSGLPKRPSSNPATQPPGAVGPGGAAAKPVSVPPPPAAPADPGDPSDPPAAKRTRRWSDSTS